MWKWLSALGNILWRIFKAIRSEITDEQWAIAVQIVKDAAVKFPDNAQRREWAVAKLMSFTNLPESVSRWLVETAVQSLKRKLSQ